LRSLVVDELSERKVDLRSRYLTSEHVTPQRTSSATTADASSHLGHVLAVVGSGTVAIASVLTVSRHGPALLVYSAVVPPVLVLCGSMILARMLKIGVHDARLAQSFNRTDHAYEEIAPEAEAQLGFLWMDGHDSCQESMMRFHPSLQGSASTPGLVI
jgi:hypothetical protein